VYLDVEELVPLWGDVETDALPGAGQRDTPYKQHEQDYEGKSGGEIHHLAHRLDPVHNAQEDHYPRSHVAEKQLPDNSALTLDSIRNLQYLVATTGDIISRFLIFSTTLNLQKMVSKFRNVTMSVILMLAYIYEI
jgi:hypothetical protein